MLDVDAIVPQNEFLVERKLAIHKIKTLMLVHQFSLADLTESAEDEQLPEGVSYLAKAAVPDDAYIKYREPDTGQVWSGEGQAPDWLKVALLKEGKTTSELYRHAQAWLKEQVQGGKIPVAGVFITRKES